MTHNIPYGSVDGGQNTFKDGWLYIGDLGYMTKEGSLVLQGLKKDIIVTSHGKNIYPSKIESMFRNNRYIDEALVVGEGRPYCSALLWVTHDNDKNDHVDFIRLVTYWRSRKNGIVNMQ